MPGHHREISWRNPRTLGLCGAELPYQLTVHLSGFTREKQNSICLKHCFWRAPFFIDESNLNWYFGKHF